jgi:hypothetical protein
MQQEHIPEVIATGCFIKSQLLHLLEIDEKDGPTYAVQYFSNNKKDYDRYIEFHAKEMRQKVMTKWGEQLVAFRSLMEIV